MSYKTITGDGKTTHIFAGSHGRCYCGLVAVFATYDPQRANCKTCLKAFKAEQKIDRDGYGNPKTKEYHVYFDQVNQTRYVINAKTPDNAIKKALKEWRSDNIPSWSSSVEVRGVQE